MICAYTQIVDEIISGTIGYYSCLLPTIRKHLNKYNREKKDKVMLGFYLPTALWSAFGAYLIESSSVFLLDNESRTPFCLIALEVHLRPELCTSPALLTLNGTDILVMANVLKVKGFVYPSRKEDVDVEQLRPANRYQRTSLIRRAAMGGIFIFSLLQLLALLGIRLPCHHGSWDYHFRHASWPNGNGITYEELQKIVQGTPTPEGVRAHSFYYTAGPHLPGQNFSQALWTQQKWQEYGIEDTSIPAYDIYLNYPLEHRLALLNKYAAKETGEITTKVAFEATLEEDVLEEDRTSGLPNRIPTFHSYSANGNVTAPFVYANFGTYDDFEELLQANVSLAGKIAIIKYGGIFRGLKVKRAQELDMVGVVLYTDPQEDEDIVEENGYKPYPEGPARNPSAVQRGSVNFLSESLSAGEDFVLANSVSRHCSW